MRKKFTSGKGRVYYLPDEALITALKPCCMRDFLTGRNQLLINTEYELIDNDWVISSSNEEIISPNQTP